MVAIFAMINHYFSKKNSNVIKVGYIYEGDESTTYTRNFMQAQQAVEQRYGDQVECTAFYNVKDHNIEKIYDDIVGGNFDIVFSTSYGYGQYIKQWAKETPNTQYCQATCSDANQGENVPNYHNFMGTIYQGRYITGVVAGAKLRDMLDRGIITQEQAVIGYVAAFPYPEVISGYTAFFMGVRSQVDFVTMKVIYTNSWSDFSGEKEAAKKLIENGCTIISQHSDTIGTAMACQAMKTQYPVFQVGYNGSMIDVAPTTSLVSSKIDWTNYEIAAIEAVIRGKKIENVVKTKTLGNDSWGGIKDGWVKVIGVNDYIAAPGTRELIDKTIDELESGRINVFKGPFTATNPSDPMDTIDLSGGYVENEKTSAPMFGYVLDGVIEIIE